MHMHIQYLVGYCASLLCLELTVFVFISAGGSYQPRASSYISVCQVSCRWYLCKFSVSGAVCDRCFLCTYYLMDFRQTYTLRMLSRSCNLSICTHSSTGPVVHALASRHEGPGVNPREITCMKPGFSC
jgi:hypothetical protein